MEAQKALDIQSNPYQKKKNVRNLISNMES